MAKNRKISAACFQERKIMHFGAVELEADDHFSSLPDHLLTHILSFLPIETAILTSMLSRRWKTLWTSLSTLNFDYSNFILAKPNRENSRFTEFVNQILELYSHSRLKICKIQLSLANYKQELPELDQWIKFAIDHDVKEINLLICGEVVEKLPDLLFTCESLEALKLNFQSRFVQPPRSVCLNGLQDLHLESVIFSDHGVQFSGPKLARLTFKECSMLHVGSMEICSSSLQTLTIVKCSNIWKCEIMVSAPNLLSLRYNGARCKNFSLENLSSLTYADIALDFHYPLTSERKRCAEYMISIIQGVKNARVIRLCSTCMQFLSAATHLSQQLPTELCNLRHLKLRVWPCKEHSDVTYWLLRRCVNLEFLSLESHRLMHSPSRTSLEDSLSRFTLHHLETVELRYFSDGNEYKLQMLKLLGNAPALKKLIDVAPDGTRKEAVF